jgi:hypothetical protein
VPAALSSAIPAAVTDPDHARPLAVGEGPGLLERLAILPDPRARRGRRHTLASVLALSTAAVLAGARSVAAIAEGAADAPGPVLAALGVRRDPLTRWQVPARPPSAGSLRAWTPTGSTGRSARGWLRGCARRAQTPTGAGR